MTWNVNADDDEEEELFVWFFKVTKRAGGTKIQHIFMLVMLYFKNSNRIFERIHKYPNKLQQWCTVFVGL